MEETVLKDMDIRQILQYHNCKYPCLMIDHMEEVIPGKSAKGYKNFTYNEWFLPAHFEDDPNVPSSVLVEAMSQTMLMTFLTLPGYARIETACLRYDRVEFKRRVIPGDRLDLCAELKMFRDGIASGKVEGYVGEEAACSASFIIGIPSIIKQQQD